VFAAAALGAMTSDNVPLAFITPVPEMMSVKFRATVDAVIAAVQLAAHVAVASPWMSYMFWVRAGAVPASPT
jgi:hypothetical protein